MFCLQRNFSLTAISNYKGCACVYMCMSLDFSELHGYNKDVLSVCVCVCVCVSVCLSLCVSVCTGHDIHREVRGQPWLLAVFRFHWTGFLVADPQVSWHWVSTWDCSDCKWTGLTHVVWAELSSHVCLASALLTNLPSPYLCFYYSYFFT